MMKYGIIIFLLIIATLTSFLFHFTQQSQISLYKGKALFERGAYQESLPFFEESLRHSKDNKRAGFLYAQALHYTGDHQAAAVVLKALLPENKE